MHSCQILKTYIQKSKPKIILQHFLLEILRYTQFWWSDGDTTPEGREIEDLFTSLGLSQIISEPTHFEPNCNPSCIDLVVTDQPNLILDSGTCASLDSFCHHQKFIAK